MSYQTACKSDDGVDRHVNRCGFQLPTGSKAVLKAELVTSSSVECSINEEVCMYCSHEEGSNQSREHLIGKGLACQTPGCTDETVISLCTGVCPEQVVECPFSNVGCGFVSKRENLLAHIEKEFPSHVIMVAQHTVVHYCIAPLVIKFKGYTHYKTSNETWYSDGFYTEVGGYQIRLEVCPNGYDVGESSHLSVFINLMPGANDDQLQFPLTGTFSVSLLNQLKDEDHFTRSINFDCSVREVYRNRKYVQDDCSWGWYEFISNSFLGFHQNTQFLKDDILYFKVSVIITSDSKNWLAEP